MITIYTSPSCTSSRRAKKWFETHDMPYQEININQTPITRNMLVQLLAKTENGFDDILSKRSNVYKAHHDDIEEMSMNQLIDFIIENPTVLKRPIIVDKTRFIVGFDEEEIRTFLPRKHRATTLHPMFKYGEEYNFIVYNTPVSQPQLNTSIAPC
ncbi:MAG TPA: transcriptional regulator Spx [Firmicutes bacterium]|nr:transcriptional regulator Spx [Bacillota bacterium]